MLRGQTALPFILSADTDLLGFTRNETEVSFIPHMCFELESTDLDFDGFILVLMRFNTQMTVAVQTIDKVAYKFRKHFISYQVSKHNEII